MKKKYPSLASITSPRIENDKNYKENKYIKKIIS